MQPLRHNSRHDMAGIIKYLAPIDNASGKIFGLKEKFVSVTRQTGTRIRGCAFMGKRDIINHPVTPEELARQEAFKAGAAIVAVRRKKTNPRYPFDMKLFHNQTKFTSFQGWLWNEVKNNTVGLDYAVIKQQAVYPGADPVEIDLSSFSTIDVKLLPGTGEKLRGQQFQVKVNGVLCSNAVVNGDLLSINNLPASLDGQTLNTVVLLTETDTYRLDY